MLFKEVNCKLNWIDANDTYVGYDTSQDCCEYADWFVHDSVVQNYTELDAIIYDDKISNYQNVEWDKYVFDRSFGILSDCDSDGGGAAVFLMIPNDGSGVKYLHLFNCHNGYYGHGFYSNTVLGNGGL